MLFADYLEMRKRGGREMYMSMEAKIYDDGNESKNVPICNRSIFNCGRGGKIHYPP
jgi:hypothetical protein